MFHSAKLTLTAWYLLIIMIISVMFSFVIYRVLTLELDRVGYQQRVRYERVERDWRIPNDLKIYLLDRLDPEVIAETKQRLVFRLILINGGIFIIASLAGYFLAGRTLKPIQQMVSEQKRFIADASHELRTPLTSLRSEIEVGLRSKSLAIDEARVLLVSNLEEVIRLQSLSESLLTLAQSGKLANNPDFTKVSLRESLEIATKKINGAIKKKKITLIQNTSDLYTSGIEDRITELFVIILDNAIKYSPSGSKVIVSIKRQGKLAVIVIKDNGIGIGKEELSHIFERFYRADISRTKITSNGFGLGLSIAKDILRNHNGTIQVKSILNKGSEFIIKLPLYKA